MALAGGKLNGAYKSMNYVFLILACSVYTYSIYIYHVVYRMHVRKPVYLLRYNNINLISAVNWADVPCISLNDQSTTSVNVITIIIQRNTIVLDC